MASSYKLPNISDICPVCYPKGIKNYVYTVQHPQKGRPGWKCGAGLRALFGIRAIEGDEFVTHWLEADKNELGEISL